MEIEVELIKNYLDAQARKIVNVDWATRTLSYVGIKQCQVRTKADPEELVRAYLITKLVNECGYLPERIEIEHEYSAGRPHTIRSRIDIIVRDSKGDAFLFIEVKNPHEYVVIDKDKTIEEQLFKLAGMERADGHAVKYLVLYSINAAATSVKDECIIIDNEKYPAFSDWETERNYTNTIPKRCGKAQKVPYVKGSEKDLEKNFSAAMLGQLQADLHNVLWGGGGTDDNEIFSSLTNLILTKIQDEGEREYGDTYSFQSLTFEKDGDEEFETNEQLFERLNALYRKALKVKLNITDEKEIEKSYVIDTKKFSLSKLKYTVQKLEGLSFVDGKNSLNGKDVLGAFFEGIIHEGFKQSRGQFFTHSNVVRFMLWAIQADRLATKRIKQDKEIPYMIDPSAGSGTFLIEYMKFITYAMKYKDRNADNTYNKELGISTDVKNKMFDWFYPDNIENRWARDYIYGVEINFNLGTATKVNMILHGDGASNIFVKDGLLPFAKYDKASAPNALCKYSEQSLYSGKFVNEQFDMILTNPPFSVELDNDTKKTVADNFIFGYKRNSENLFIERWYQLLRENGRLAAVLPESVFDTVENKYIRLFIYKYFKIKAVISLPQLTFEPYTSTKTSILFAQKKTKQEIKQWDAVWSEFSNIYRKLKTQVENLMAVRKGTKKAEKLPSIKALTSEQKAEIIRRALKYYVSVKPAELSADDLIDRYSSELEEFCKIDKDTAEFLGHVNTWWVFGEVAAALDYSIFMAEAENIGYKRTKRGEKRMPNDLFRQDRSNRILVDDGIKTTVLDYMRELNWD